MLLLWIAIAAGATVLGRASGGETTDGFSIPAAESQRAIEVLEARFPAVSGASAQVVFTVGSGTLGDAGPAATIESTLAEVRALSDVTQIAPLRTSADARIGYVEVRYSRSSDEIAKPAFAALEKVAERATANGVRTELGGELANEAVQEPPGGQEIVGLLVAVVVLLFAFGSFIAMGLPIGTALFGIATSIGLITFIASLIDISTGAPVLASMIGLGVGIDYALFIVTRHREFLLAGHSVEEAAGRALATSGTAVLFAGATVVIAICGLAITGISMVTRMGLMSALTVAIMVLVSLTLLPALLGFAGHRLLKSRLRRRAAEPGYRSRWYGFTRHVSEHPWRYLIAGTGVLLIAAAPLVSLELGMADAGNSSESLTTRRSYDLMAEGFGRGFNGPLVLAVELDNGVKPDALAPLVVAIGADPGVHAVSPPQPSPDGTAALIQVISRFAPQAHDTTALVHRLRDVVIPTALRDQPDVNVFIGGRTAMFIDLSDTVNSRMPWFIGAVILLSIVLLMMVFRSVAVPLKAAAMNLLSIGAAYGVVIAVFQWGWLGSLFGVRETVPIISFLPMMMFAVLFGLSMDYEVFLLSRVREEYQRGRDNTTAVVEGIASTGRVITSAALIMISVFASFILGKDATIKMFGLGLSVAVLVDATLVRMVLVPATMRLLGDRNWWLPVWLDRVLPRFDVEGHLPTDETPARHRDLEPA